MKEKEYYREQIVEMIQKIDNIEWLVFIHRIIENLLK